MEDFNCNVHRHGANGHKFGDGLLRYSKEENLVISDLHFLPNDSYTYLRDTHQTIYRRDHVLSTHSAHCLIKEIEVLYECMS